MFSTTQLTEANTKQFPRGSRTDGKGTREEQFSSNLFKMVPFNFTPFLALMSPLILHDLYGTDCVGKPCFLIFFYKSSLVRGEI